MRKRERPAGNRISRFDIRPKTVLFHQEVIEFSAGFETKREGRNGEDEFFA